MNYTINGWPHTPNRCSVHLPGAHLDPITFDAVRLTLNCNPTYNPRDDSGGRDRWQYLPLCERVCKPFFGLVSRVCPSGTNVKTRDRCERSYSEVRAFDHLLPREERIILHSPKRRMATLNDAEVPNMCSLHIAGMHADFHPPDNTTSFLERGSAGASSASPSTSLLEFMRGDRGNKGRRSAVEGGGRGRGRRAGRGAGATPTPAYDVHQGWPTNTGLLSAQTTGIDEATCRGMVPSGGGYYYDSRHSGGWCKTITAANVAVVRAAVTTAWDGGQGSWQNTYLPATPAPTTSTTNANLNIAAGIGNSGNLRCPQKCMAPETVAGTATFGGKALEAGVCKYWASAVNMGVRYCGDGTVNNPHHTIFNSGDAVDCSALCQCPAECQAPNVSPGGANNGGVALSHGAAGEICTLWASRIYGTMRFCGDADPETNVEWKNWRWYRQRGVYCKPFCLPTPKPICPLACQAPLVESGPVRTGGLDVRNGICHFWSAAPSPDGKRRCGNGEIDNPQRLVYRDNGGIKCGPLCLCPDDCKAPMAKDGDPSMGGVDLDHGQCKMWASPVNNTGGVSAYLPERKCGNGDPSNPHAAVYTSPGGVNCFSFCGCPKECKAPYVRAGGNRNGGAQLEDGICKQWTSIWGEGGSLIYSKGEEIPIREKSGRDDLLQLSHSFFNSRSCFHSSASDLFPEVVPFILFFYRYTSSSSSSAVPPGRGASTGTVFAETVLPQTRTAIIIGGRAHSIARPCAHKPRSSRTPVRSPAGRRT